MDAETEGYSMTGKHFPFLNKPYALTDLLKAVEKCFEDSSQ